MRSRVSSFASSSSKIKTPKDIWDLAQVILEGFGVDSPEEFAIIRSALFSADIN